MNYLLTQEEYDSLRNEGKQRLGAKTQEFQDFCTKVAKELPIQWWSRTDPPKPWGCIIDKSQVYCDLCPARKFCPYFGKEFSK